MSAIHTPFLGGTGFGGLADSGADSALAPPYVPGAESPASDEEAKQTAPEAGFTAAETSATVQETVEDQAAEDQIADWAQDIIEETEVEEGDLAPAADIGALGPKDEEETVEEPFEEVLTGTGEAANEEPAREEPGESESEFPEFLFGGDSSDQETETSMPSSGDVADESDVSRASGASQASGLDPETRERIRALAKELEGDDAAEDVIARAFEEGYRKAREEEA